MDIVLVTANFHLRKNNKFFSEYSTFSSVTASWIWYSYVQNVLPPIDKKKNKQQLTHCPAKELSAHEVSAAEARGRRRLCLISSVENGRSSDTDLVLSYGKGLMSVYIVVSSSSLFFLQQS